MNPPIPTTAASARAVSTTRIQRRFIRSGPCQKAVRNAKGGRRARPSPTGYEAALISVTWMVLEALSKVPVTSTFCPANEAGFFWSSSW